MLDAMSRLATPEFYQRLSELKCVASNFCTHVNSDGVAVGPNAGGSSSNDGADCVTESDGEDCYLFEEIDTIRDIQENDELRDATKVIRSSRQTQAGDRSYNMDQLFPQSNSLGHGSPNSRGLGSATDAAHEDQQHSTDGDAVTTKGSRRPSSDVVVLQARPPPSSKNLAEEDEVESPWRQKGPLCDSNLAIYSDHSCQVDSLEPMHALYEAGPKRIPVKMTENS